MLSSVTPLQVHLPNNQSISFKGGEDIESIIEDDYKSRISLIEFFKVNQEDNSGVKYLYCEFPKHFVWDKNKKRWRERKGQKSVGRLVFANPIEGERYYLRLLLCHVRGPTSYDDLLTVNNEISYTFQQAAIKRGLVEDDNSALWNRFYCHLSEDFQHQHPLDPERVLHLMCQDVEYFLQTMGKSFLDFGLPHLHNLNGDNCLNSKDVIYAINAPVPDEYHGIWKNLNDGQRKAYKAIMKCVTKNRSGVFFIDGPEGTGKTFLYQSLYARIRLQGKVVLPTATSGIVASNIPSGRTTHSRFKIPLDLGVSMTCNVPKQGDLAKLFRKVALIIWDEASMAKREGIEYVDLLLRDICNYDKPFGGKVFVFGGDFRQVLPVIPKKSQPEIVDASLVSSHLWPRFQRFMLHKNMRAQEDSIFLDFLLSLGDGRLQDGEVTAIKLLVQLICHLFDEINQVQNLVHCVYPDLASLAHNPKAFLDRVILNQTNDEVDAINRALIRKFPGSLHTFKSFDSVIDDHCNTYPIEFLDTLCPGGMSPHDLNLKISCLVVLLRNRNPSIGLCNGTSLICR